jgi:hypothetical protein
MTTNLRKLGFCGADESANPLLMGLICQSYPFVEFGVLFRPDMEGKPRYPAEEWVNKLAAVARASRGKMGLAAHLCGQRCQEILDAEPDDTFVSTLFDRGFRRVQINATAQNRVSLSREGMDVHVRSLASVMLKHPELEFIIQRNGETKPLYEGLLESPHCGQAGLLPANVTMLVDESKGTGIRGKHWPSPPQEYDIGYAGGIGPLNLHSILKEVLLAANGRNIWVDMETSLRSMKNGTDVFDLEKCYECIGIVCESGLYSHPSFLPS